MFHMVNHNTLVHARFCIWLHEMYPCKDESIIIIGGTNDRNTWRIWMGRYPVITWLTTALQINIGKLYLFCKSIERCQGHDLNKILYLKLQTQQVNFLEKEKHLFTQNHITQMRMPTIMSILDVVLEYKKVKLNINVFNLQSQYSSQRWEHGFQLIKMGKTLN